jgi:hypothetical protein
MRPVGVPALIWMALAAAGSLAAALPAHPDMGAPKGAVWKEQSVEILKSLPRGEQF